MFNLFKKIPSISPQDLAKKLGQPLLLLDVRTPAEFQSGHISKAKNVPLNKLGTYQQEGSEAIYVICQSGGRSKQACKILQKKGYPVVNVKGGMNRWTGPVKGGKY